MQADGLPHHCHFGLGSRVGILFSPLALPHSVLLIEDDVPIRERMAVALSAHGDMVIEQVGSLAEADIALNRHPPPALIVSDLGLPDGSAIGLIQNVRERLPATEVLVISALGDETTILAAVEAGASGFLLKDAHHQDIHEAALAVLGGGSPISPSIARHILVRARSNAAPNPRTLNSEIPALTPRQLDILWGIAKGFTYGEIAERLDLSHLTVPSHVKAIYSKLQVNNRGSAVYEAIVNGLIKL